MITPTPAPFSSGRDWPALVARVIARVPEMCDEVQDLYLAEGARILAGVAKPGEEKARAWIASITEAIRANRTKRLKADTP